MKYHSFFILVNLNISSVKLTEEAILDRYYASRKLLVLFPFEFKNYNKKIVFDLTKEIDYTVGLRQQLLPVA